ncbi:hypothetical protein BDP55DRAFT_636815 [Colletotrichum godetiae]|uniref:Uncharacterized protein n=1 Tax=Colletotrichum godetiae TaxID=1209918 RepID=A0AAJ0EN76_9PEZI|nr:uncharacterized protein BDP55DRAFT_636815 [Colletotrichum godetiae]KAK1659505.1 hypothetical protein BDP55DRAFT_636815 [Colletotrichum godetiae]
MAGRKRPVTHVDMLNHLGASERVPKRHPINRVTNVCGVPTKETRREVQKRGCTWKSCAAVPLRACVSPGVSAPDIMYKQQGAGILIDGVKVSDLSGRRKGRWLPFLPRLLQEAVAPQGRRWPVHVGTYLLPPHAGTGPEGKSLETLDQVFKWTYGDPVITHCGSRLVHASQSPGPTSGFRDWPNGGKGNLATLQTGPPPCPPSLQSLPSAITIPFPADSSTRPLALPPLPHPVWRATGESTSGFISHKLASDAYSTALPHCDLTRHSTLDSQNQGTREALRRTPHSSRRTAASRSKDSVSQLPHPHPSRPYRACAASLHLHADHSSESTPRRFRDRNTARRIETGSSPAKHHISPTITTLLHSSLLVPRNDVSTR